MARLSDLVGKREQAGFPAGCEIDPAPKPGSLAALVAENPAPVLDDEPWMRVGEARVSLRDDDLTHVNEQGRARMVDVTDKDKTSRSATAAGFVGMAPSTVELVRTGGCKKGDVLAVAQVAGVMAAKRTWELVPMCHPIALTGVDLRFDVRDDGVAIEATCRCVGETGVEMEALTAVSVAALTVYDMLKAHQRDMVIESVRLMEKTGGRSGRFVRED